MATRSRPTLAATAILLLAAAPLAPIPAPALAQPVPAAPVAGQDAHGLDRAFLVKAGIDKQLDGVVLATRDLMIVTFKGRGVTDDNAAALTDRYMMPEFRARLPELLQRFEDVLVKDFTVPELQAILNQQPGAALESAKVKAGQLPAHFSIAGQDWGKVVGADAYSKNKADIDKLATGAKP